MNDLDFREKVAAFLAYTGMAPSTFGLKAMQDSGFVKSLSQGRSVSLKNAEKCKKFMDDYLSDVAK